MKINKNLVDKETIERKERQNQSNINLGFPEVKIIGPDKTHIACAHERDYTSR